MGVPIIVQARLPGLPYAAETRLIPGFEPEVAKTITSSLFRSLARWWCPSLRRWFGQARQNIHPGLLRQHAKDSGFRDRRHRPMGIFFSLSLEHGCFFIRIADQ